MDRQYARISEAAATGIRDMEIYRGKIISVASETVALPNGRTLEMEVVHHPGGAAVVALDERRQVCLLRQYRPALDLWLWELPAGKIDHGEPPLNTAQRELMEEAGRIAARWERLGEVVSSPGVFTERVSLFLARDLTRVDGRPEIHEVFEIHWIPFEDAVRRARNGDIADGKSVIGLLRADAWMVKA